MGANEKGKTFSLRNYLAIVLASVALLIESFGCAHRPQVKAVTSGNESWRITTRKFTEAELGRIVVVSACSKLEPEYFEKPLTKEKAVGMGAWKAFSGSLDAAPRGGDPYAGAIWIPFSFIVTASGAVYGAIEGKPKETIRKAEETLNHYLTDLQQMMQERIIFSAQKKTQCTFVVPDQCVPYDLSNIKDIDTILEISVWRFGLWGEKDLINPPLSLFMIVRIRLIRIKDNTELFSDTFRYESRKKQKFTKWAKKDAQLFREELDRCLGSLAERIVAELFIN